MKHSQRAISAVCAVAVALVATEGWALDRLPELLEFRQVPATNKVRLLWAPGGNADGTLSYTPNGWHDGAG